MPAQPIHRRRETPLPGPLPKGWGEGDGGLRLLGRSVRGWGRGIVGWGVGAEGGGAPEGGGQQVVEPATPPGEGEQDENKKREVEAPGTLLFGEGVNEVALCAGRERGDAGEGVGGAAEGRLILALALTAQPLASSSGPRLRLRSLSQARIMDGPEMMRIMASTPRGIRPFRLRNPLMMPPTMPPTPAAPTLKAAMRPGSTFGLGGSGAAGTGGCPETAAASTLAAACASLAAAAASALAARLAICSWTRRAAFL